MTNSLKTFISFFIVVLIVLSCGKDKFDLSNVPKQDIYKENYIKFEYKNQSDKKEGSRELNDQLSLDVYVPDYTKEKGEEVCKFYDEYFKTDANRVDKKLTIEIGIWNKRIDKIDAENPKMQDQFFKGGLTHNYKNDLKEMNLYK